MTDAAIAARPTRTERKSLRKERKRIQILIAKAGPRRPDLFQICLLLGSVGWLWLVNIHEAAQLTTRLGFMPAEHPMSMTAMIGAVYSTFALFIAIAAAGLHLSDRHSPEAKPAAVSAWAWARIAAIGVFPWVDLQEAALRGLESKEGFVATMQANGQGQWSTIVEGAFNSPNWHIPFLFGALAALIDAAFNGIALLLLASPLLNIRKGAVDGATAKEVRSHNINYRWLQVAGTLFLIFAMAMIGSPISVR